MSAILIGQGPLIYSTTAAFVDGNNETGPFVIQENETTVPVTGVADKSLRIAQDDIEYLNRIFRERTHEIGYCGFIKSGHLQPWLADTIQSSQSTMKFSTANCQTATDKGALKATLHTHPNGQAKLSKGDVQTLVESPTEIMCVQAGQITTDSGTITKNLRCYRMAQSDSHDTLKEIKVVVN